MKFDFKNNIFVDCDINKNKLAISGSDTDILWEELAENVLKLENIFSNFKIPKGQLVVIYGHKESFYAQAILALIKSDIPYVPIDEIYPIERIKRIKRITKSQVLINCSDKKIDIPFAIEINKNFEVHNNFPANYSSDIIFNSKNPLRYIMFTSGSTGEPKGVQISKKNIISFLDWIEKDYNFNTNDVFLNQSPFTFDVSLYDILSAFMIGASVLLVSRDLISNSELFMQTIKKYQVSVWTSTPSFAYIFVREKSFNSSFLPKLKTFIFAGEVLSFKLVKSLLKKFNKSMIINAYGPTEATITTTWIKISEKINQENYKMPIGYPRRNSEVLILNKTNDKSKQGEIVIVGDHVSNGYFNDNELTKQKFYKHNGKQAFKTGDLGYYENEMVYFIGRTDDQIKLHGYRIELGEIDTQLINLPFIEDAITIALKKEEEVKRIISFVIVKSNNIENVKGIIINNIEGKLPSYMIPSDIVAIDKFPVNSNYKIDKNELIQIYRKM